MENIVNYPLHEYFKLISLLAPWMNNLKQTKEVNLKLLFRFVLMYLLLSQTFLSGALLQDFTSLS